MSPDDFFKNKIERQECILMMIFKMLRLGFSEDNILNTTGIRADTLANLRECYRIALSTVDFEIDLESPKIQSMLDVYQITCRMKGQRRFSL